MKIISGQFLKIAENLRRPQVSCLAVGYFLGYCVSVVFQIFYSSVSSCILLFSREV